jgi:hypothetical protein
VTVAVAPGTPETVAVGTAVGGVPSVVMTTLSMSGAGPTEFAKARSFLPACSVAVMRRVPGREVLRVPGKTIAVGTPPFTLICAVRLRSAV